MWGFVEACSLLEGAWGSNGGVVQGCSMELGTAGGGAAAGGAGGGVPAEGGGLVKGYTAQR